jgi:formylglycine-generating enzyme required for sulfatase activity
LTEFKIWYRCLLENNKWELFMKMFNKLQGLRSALLLVVFLSFSIGCSKTTSIQEKREQLSVKGITFTMIRIQAMAFPGGPMGITEYQEGREDILRVEEDFWLAETNTTYLLWSTVYKWASAKGYKFNRQGRMGSEENGQGMNEQHPVTIVDWASAMVWCNALTEYYNESNGTSLKPVYEYQGAIVRDASDEDACDAVEAQKGADGFRLPREAEWELAARYATEKRDDNYQEYPAGSGIYWAPFLYVSGEIEGTVGMMGSEKGRIVTVEVSKTAKNPLGFYGFAGKEGKLWQWCFEKVPSSSKTEKYRVKRGGSRGPRCSRHDFWPKTQWLCGGYNQISFRVARTAVVE